MEFVRIQQVEFRPEQAVRRLRRTLKRNGFSQPVELNPSGDGEGGQEQGSRLVVAYCAELASRTRSIAPEAALLLVVPFLIQASGAGSQMITLDPEVLSLVPGRSDLQTVVRDLRDRMDRTIEGVKVGSDSEEEEEESESSIQSTLASEQVEQRMYSLILEGLENLEGELPKKADDVLTLAKAYAAVASLNRAEEVELHLS